MQTADFTIAEFLAWARTKPADGEYNYCNAIDCAVSQYGRETGRPELIDLTPSGIMKLGVHAAVNYGLGRSTFGALVSRLEALLPAEPLSDTWTKADAYLTDIEDVARERVVS